VEDAAQEVFMRVHEKLPECDTSRPLRPWLFTFAYYWAANYRRLARHRHEVSATSDEAQGAELYRSDDPEVRIEARGLLVRALQELPPPRRAVVIMHELDGFNAREIAERLDIPEATVYSRLRVGRRELVDAVNTLQGEGAP
jgi:RNA polymerase sigma-70 factor (ECF subfamily)